jgi:hypothetical protein
MKLSRMIPAVLAAVLLALPAMAHSAEKPVVRPVGKPKVYFNQDFIESLYTKVDIKNEMAVFKLVFGALRDKVRVYPTENYYYFSFLTGGKVWWGNLRFDAIDRDKGILHLGYFKFDEYGRYDEDNNYYKNLTAKDGVILKKVSDFVYTVTFEGRTVTFQLNDVGWKPPVKSKLRKVETYVGPVFDESGTRFHLIFDNNSKHFMYLLNEDGPVPEHFINVNRAVVVGERTGFAYFIDRAYDRKILIGVHGRNAQRNNYYDGPFDQLPDNYIDKAKMGEYIVKAYPFTKGRIDKYGNYTDREAARFSISNYLIYEDVDKLNFVFDCMKRYREESSFYRCLTPDTDDAPVETTAPETNPGVKPAPDKKSDDDKPDDKKSDDK